MPTTPSDPTVAASILGLDVAKGVAPYAVSKAGVIQLTKAMAVELAFKGIRVNAIAPGWIESPMLTAALSGDEPRKNKILSRTPMAKFGQGDDIGWAAVYLCSPAAKFVTGTVLPVDGGASIGF